MNARTDEPETSLTYTLSCVDCPFEATVEGDAIDVLDVVDVHQDEHRNDTYRHFVEFETEEVG